MGNTYLSTSQSFPDVNQNDWFAPYVKKATREGLLDGYPDGRFGSWDPINRAEMAKVVVNLKQQLQHSWIEDNGLGLIIIFILIIGWVSILTALKKITHPNTIIQTISPESNTTLKQEMQSRRYHLRKRTRQHHPPLKNERNTAQTSIKANEQSIEKNQSSNWWV